MKVFNMSSSLFNPHHPHYHDDHNHHHQWRSWQDVSLTELVINSGSWVPPGQTGESIPQFGEVRKKQIWQILFKRVFCQPNTCHIKQTYASEPLKLIPQDSLFFKSESQPRSSRGCQVIIEWISMNPSNFYVFLLSALFISYISISICTFICLHRNCVLS